MSPTPATGSKACLWRSDDGCVFFQAEDGIRDIGVTGVQTCALPIWLEFLANGVDLLVSNPPYIKTDEIPNLQPEVRDWDPAFALDGGPDGLAYYRRIFEIGRASCRERV